MSDSLNGATKYVATHRPDSLAWGPAKALGADIVEGIRRIKEEDGPQLIVWGSSELTPVLLEHELADEVLLLVFPVLLGKANVFFRMELRHANSRSSAQRLWVGRRHQYLQAERSFAHQLLRRRGGVS